MVNLLNVNARSLLLAGVFLLAGAAAGQAQYQVQAWNTDNGLPQNTVSSVVQTRDGYIWLATLDGLVRFDGVRFTVFNTHNTPGIASNRFTKLIEDGTGDLWVGTEDSGITRYSHSTFHTFGVGEGVEFRGAVTKLFLDRDAGLIVFTDRDMVRWTGTSFRRYQPVAGENNASTILWAKTGAFWWSDGTVVHRLRDGAVTDFPLPGDFLNGLVLKLFEDRIGRIWIGTRSSSLYVIEQEKAVTVLTKPLTEGGNLEPTLADRDGNVWVVSSDGVVIVAPDGVITRLTPHEGLSDRVIASACEDREGNIWLGTLYRGLDRLNKQSVKFISVVDGLKADVVNPIFEDPSGTIWIGGKALTRLQNGVFSAVPGSDKFSSGEVTAIYQDREGRQWFGHWNGAYYYEAGKLTNFTSKYGPNLTVSVIHEDQSGNMWFGTPDGLFRFRNGVKENLDINHGLAGNDVKAILETPDGTLWFGTYGGLSRYRNGVFKSYTMKDGLASNQVRSLYFDADGVLWIGTYDGGLARLKDDKIVRYTTNEGLFNDGVFQILEDDNKNLWMSCNRGIYRVAKQQLNDFADGKIARIGAVAYGKADGLIETECNGGQQPAGIKTRDGRLWFPTQHGVAVIDPSKVVSNPIAPPIQLESYALNGAQQSFSNEVIKIAPNIENLEIAYTGLSFIRPEQVRFRYKMIGWDSDWIEAGSRRTAYYAHLSPGEYTFNVIAANSDGVWNLSGASIRVVVQPPFYRTWWFLMLVLLTTSGVLIFVYLRRVRQLRHENAQQEEFSRRLIESQERERGRIAAELHDGLSQSLVIIKNRAVLSLTAPDNEARAFEQLEEISAAASEAMLEAKDIIYDLRPIQLDRFGLAKTARSMLKKLGDAHNLEIATDIDSIDGLLSKEAETSLYRILQELANNIVRHSAASKAEVSLNNRNGSLMLIVRDNGKGFAMGQINQDQNYRGGFGLVSLIERAKLLNGRATIQSTVGIGTGVTVTIPVRSI